MEDDKVQRKPIQIGEALNAVLRGSDVVTQALEPPPGTEEGDDNRLCIFKSLLGRCVQNGLRTDQTGTAGEPTQR